MKKLLSFVVLSTMFVSTFSQDTSSYKKSLRLEMISAFVGKIGVHYEMLKQDKSFLMNVAYRIPTTDEPRRVFEIYPEFRKYFKDVEKTDSWYVGPHLRYRYVTDGDIYKTYSYGFGVSFGYQLEVVKGFVINAYLGPDYAMGNVKLKEGYTYDGSGFGYGDAYYNPENDIYPSGYAPSVVVPRFEGVLINGGVSIGIIF